MASPADPQFDLYHEARTSPKGPHAELQQPTGRGGQQCQDTAPRRASARISEQVKHQQASVAETLEEGASDEEHDLPTTTGSGARRHEAHELTLHDLRNVFHLNMPDAAERLGVKPLLLKRKCQELGIVRWPRRNILSLIRLREHHLKKPAADQTLLGKIEQELQGVYSDPNRVIDVELINSRDHMYKDRYAHNQKEIKRKQALALRVKKQRAQAAAARAGRVSRGADTGDTEQRSRSRKHSSTGKVHALDALPNIIKEDPQTDEDDANVPTAGRTARSAFALPRVRKSLPRPVLKSAPPSNDMPPGLWRLADASAEPNSSDEQQPEPSGGFQWPELKLSAPAVAKWPQDQAPTNPRRRGLSAKGLPDLTALPDLPTLVSTSRKPTAQSTDLGSPQTHKPKLNGPNWQQEQEQEQPLSPSYAPTELLSRVDQSRPAAASEYMPQPTTEVVACRAANLCALVVPSAAEHGVAAELRTHVHTWPRAAGSAPVTLIPRVKDGAVVGWDLPEGAQLPLSSIIACSPRQHEHHTAVDLPCGGGVPAQQQHAQQACQLYAPPDTPRHSTSTHVLSMPPPACRLGVGRQSLALAHDGGLCVHVNPGTAEALACISPVGRAGYRVLQQEEPWWSGSGHNSGSNNAISSVHLPTDVLGLSSQLSHVPARDTWGMWDKADVGPASACAAPGSKNSVLSTRDEPPPLPVLATAAPLSAPSGKHWSSCDWKTIDGDDELLGFLDGANLQIAVSQPANRAQTMPFLPRVNSTSAPGDGQLHALCAKHVSQPEGSHNKAPLRAGMHSFTPRSSKAGTPSHGALPFSMNPCEPQVRDVPSQSTITYGYSNAAGVVTSCDEFAANAGAALAAGAAQHVGTPQHESPSHGHTHAVQELQPLPDHDAVPKMECGLNTAEMNEVLLNTGALGEVDLEMLLSSIPVPTSTTEGKTTGWKASNGIPSDRATTPDLYHTLDRLFDSYGTADMLLGSAEPPDVVRLMQATAQQAQAQSAVPQRCYQQSLCVLQAPGAGADTCSGGGAQGQRLNAWQLPTWSVAGDAEGLDMLLGSS